MPFGLKAGLKADNICSKGCPEQRRPYGPPLGRFARCPEGAPMQYMPKGATSSIGFANRSLLPLWAPFGVTKKTPLGIYSGMKYIAETSGPTFKGPQGPKRM